MFGNSFNIFLVEQGSGSFTTIGAFEAVDFFEGLFVKFGEGFQHGVFICTLKVLAVKFLSLARFLFPVVKKILHAGAKVRKRET